jgi:hypothetical protein
MIYPMTMLPRQCPQYFLQRWLVESGSLQIPRVPARAAQLTPGLSTQGRDGRVGPGEGAGVILKICSESNRNWR